MTLLILPRRPRRAWLRAFWLSLCAWAALLAGVVLGPGRWLPVLASATLVLLPGLLRPGLVAPAYRLWERLTRTTALRVRRYTLRVCFHVLMRFAHRDVPALRLARPAPGGSLWVEAPRLTPAAYLSPDGSIRRARKTRGWIANYLAWAARPGRVWTMGLFPFLLVLRLVALEEESEYPTGIYTLY